MDSAERGQGPARGPAAHPGEGTVAGSDVAHLCVIPDPRALPGQGRARGSHFKATGSTSLHPTAPGISVWATRRRCLPEPPGPRVGGGWTTRQHRWACVLFRYSGSNWWVLGGPVDLGAPSPLQGPTCFQAFLGVWRGKVGNQNPRPERPVPRLVLRLAGAHWVGPCLAHCSR
ncbi:hypothetical protein NN561_009602 [Cricetulus griseus]